MTTRSLSLSLLALTTSLVLSACSTEATPTAPTASTGAGSGAASAPADSGVEPTGVAAPRDAVVDADAVLEVEDQVSEGPTVNVKAAAITAGGWVVVASDGGRNVLGYGEVPAGTEPQVVQVSLADIILEETELTARLYDDANADGFYGAGDNPVSNGDDDDDDLPGGENETFSFRGADVINN